jgi:PAS domain S-box-containing protein
MKSTTENLRTAHTDTDLSESPQDIFAHAYECVARVDSQGCYLSVNDAYADVCGYSQDEMLGMVWHETVHPDDLEIGEQTPNELLHNGRSYRYRSIEWQVLPL